MKQSLIPTQYLLVEANTSSNWDNCNFMIIKITDQWITEIAKRIKLAMDFKSEKDFEHIAFYEAPQGFFVANNQTQAIIDQMEISAIDRCYVNTDETEIQSLELPETRLEHYLLKVDAYGAAWYTAVGEHSGEEFYSMTFRAQEILAETGLNF